MYQGDPKEYFGVGVGSAPKKPATGDKMDKPMDKGDDGDKGVTIHVAKKGDKLHTTIDKHDGYPPDEMDHESMDDAKAAHGAAMDEKYGDQPDDSDTGDNTTVSDDSKHKPGSYMQNMNANC